MCGIAGILHLKTKQSVSESVLRSMGEALRHRGPDDFGIYQDGSFGVAHSRLSIIDTSSAGHQPMVTPDGRYCIAFNGEIYNYKELRSTYVRDVSFASQTDTEVFLHLLIEQGERALHIVRGMYAFALWDQVQHKLILGRDPFGKKPLYFMHDENSFIFASEVKAILATVGRKVDADEEAIVKYFLFEYAPAPSSGYASIRQVPMGSIMTINASGKMSVRSFWKPQFVPKKHITEKRALTRLDELLGIAVERRLVADVPVGVFLSGGIDSTTIGWYMKRAGARDVHSCSVTFREKSFDESRYASLAARALHTNHHAVAFTIDDFHTTLHDVVRLLDVPLADVSVLPTYTVSRLARRYMKVVLDGDGGDELFGGYGTFQAAQLSRWLEWLPSGFLRRMYGIARLLPVSHTYFSYDFIIKTFLKGMPYPIPERNQVWLGSFSDIELRSLLADNVRSYIEHVFDDIHMLTEQVEGLSTFDSVSLLTMLHYMHNQILVKLDRATMMVGLEARTPYLDVDLADFVMKLPNQFKRKKHLLKKLMHGRIPDEIIHRKKQGFGIPLGYWLQGPLYQWACDVLREDRISQSGMVQPGAALRMLHEHRSGTADHRKKLWTLIVFQLWYERWVRK